MKCAYDAELLSRYLEEDLSPGEMSEATAHLEECPACRRELERLRTAMEIMKSVTDVAVPRNYAETTKVHEDRHGGDGCTGAEGGRGRCA